MKPLQRHPDLIALSQDHHHTLALCARIMRGEYPPAEHIRAHCAELAQHFAEEETQFAPLWPRLPDPALQQRFHAEHAALRALFQNADFNDPEQQRHLAQLLRTHIRFEERELFEAFARYALPPFQAA